MDLRLIRVHVFSQRDRLDCEHQVGGTVGAFLHARVFIDGELVNGHGPGRWREVADDLFGSVRVPPCSG